MTKYLIILFIALLPLFSQAQTTYYVSNEGSSSNNGTSTSTTWNLAKVNSFTSFVAGDQILFKKGETFYGSITVNNSGTSGNPITYGAYGTGSDPVITGFTTVSSWTNISGNIWESTNAVSALSTCNVVSVNGTNTAMGRYPNSTWNTIKSSTVNSITDASLNAIDWTGAEVVIKQLTYVVDRFTINSESSKTLNFTNTNYTPQVGWGYFIQNGLSALDSQNEWYYNPSTKKIDVYSTSEPTGVQVSTADVLVDLHLKDYITFDGLNFEGANSKSFFIGSSKNITIKNCSFNNNGWTAIYGENYAADNYSDNLTIQNCSFNHNPQGIKIDSYFHNAYINNNDFINTGLIYGSWTNEEVQASAIISRGDNSIIEYNRIDSTGYIGIYFTGDNVVVRYNYLTNALMTLDDGGAIYTVGFPPGSGRKIYNNIVLNNAGTSSGTGGSGVIAYGIYMDDYANSVEIFNNTVASCADGGIYIHNADSMYIHNNLCYDNDNNGGIVLDGNDTYLRNARVHSNILIAKTSDQRTATYKSSSGNYISSFGVMDSNYYARPIDGNSNIDAVYDFTDHPLTLSGWQSFSSQDANAHGTNKTVISTDSLSFIYNATNEAVTNALPYKYLDVTDGVFDGAITLQPYTGAVLIQDGSATPVVDPPIVSTSGDQTLTTNSTTVFSTSSAADGETITGYAWTDITGSGTANITSPTSQNTGITNLSVGTHTFRITVTQSDGQTAHADVSVTLTAPPTANAGTDQTITLPTSSVTLSGSGIVASGQTASYLWTKVSGSGTQTITNNTTLTPTVSGMTTAGDYVFQLKVTQTDTQFATSTVTVHVNAAPTPQTPVIYFHKPTIVVQIQ
jgi:parallel beta-helix repeat protein